MDNIIIEEFKHYKVFLYGRQAQGQQTDYGININIPSGKVIIKFCMNWMRENYYEDKNGKYTFNVFLRTDKYINWIDLLRNEKPLFFCYNLDTNICYITTSDEPVGEAENSED